MRILDHSDLNMVQRSRIFVLALILTLSCFSMPLQVIADSIGSDQSRSQVEDRYKYLTVIVEDKNGQMIEDANIRVERGKNDWQTHYDVTPENGVYPIDVGDDFGYCRIYVDKDGYKSQDIGFTPSNYADDNVTISVSLEANDPVDVVRDVKFRIVDSSGKEIDGATVLLECAEGYSYNTVSPKAPLSYSLREKDQNNRWYLDYRFSAMAQGFTRKANVSFSFDPGYGNPYFNVWDMPDPIVITVSLKSQEETLNEAKQSAISALRSYKDKSDYREKEQRDLEEIISKWTKNINDMDSTTGVSWALDEAKKELDKVKTNADYENEEWRKYIFFRSSDGKTTVYPDSQGVIRLIAQDIGNLYLENASGGTYQNNGVETYWRCVQQYDDGHGGYGWNYILNPQGVYQPRLVGTFDATVTLNANGVRRTIPFKIGISNGAYDELRTIVDGYDVTSGTVHTLGSEPKVAIVQAHLSGTDRWVNLPINAIEFENSGSVSVNHTNGTFRAWGTGGRMTYYLTTNKNVKAYFDVISDPIRVTGMDVYVPSPFYVDTYSQMTGNFVGIGAGDANETNRYHVTIYPSNATNPAVTWEALTPDIATQSDLHSSGIVPRKAGTAEFIVRSVDNPSIFKKVSIKFIYKNPLHTAEVEQDTYYMTVGQTKEFNVITNGQKDSSKGASDQRFKWTYGTPGIATVGDRVTASSDYSGSKTTSHRMTAIKEGVVYVTGTPYDDSEGCKPVSFKIVVTSDIDKDREAAKRVEDLINVIGDVTPEKKLIINRARNAFDALTKVQKDLVDDEIYAKLIAAELKLRQLERELKDPRGDRDDNNVTDPGNNNDNSDRNNVSDNDNSNDNNSDDASRNNVDDSNRGVGRTNNGTPGGGNTSGNSGNPDSGTAKSRDANSISQEVENPSDIDAAPVLDEIEPDEVAEENASTAEETVKVREAIIDKVPEDVIDTAIKVNRVLLWLLLFLLFDALIYGMQKKYREFRRETR